MPRPLLRRALRGILYTCATLFLLWATLIAGPMWLTRIRMAYLLADFQSIHPTQSTWAEAQRLMTRWGKWGHYEGTCTANFCNYEILVDDPTSDIVFRAPSRMADGLQNLGVFAVLQRLGWRESSLSLGFIVRDSVLTSTLTTLRIQVPNYAADQGDTGYTLQLRTQVRPRLKAGPQQYRRTRWILGNNEQLADHPDYKVGRPSGCLGCLSYEITYTPALSHSEIIRLTSYDLSCLTRRHPCLQLFDLLSVARQWDFYSPPDNNHLQATSCNTDGRALGRDAEFVLEVDAIAVKKVPGTVLDGITKEPYEIATTRVVRTLKGRPVAKFGAEEDLIGFPGTPNTELPEHLNQGNRYFVILDSVESDSNSFEIPRCGVLEATPENLQRLSLGIAEDRKYHDIDNPDR